MSAIDFENNFFGRKAKLDLLHRRVTGLKEGYRQNLAFIGERFIGKSLLLRKFISQIDDNDIIDIYLDLENKDFDYVFTKFSGSILYNYSKSKKLVLHDDINLLLEGAKKFIPQTVEAIRKIRILLRKGKTTEAYRDLIALPEIFTTESGKFCVIILDEFHCLAEFAIVHVFQELGKKIMTQKKCLYIVTSSNTAIAKEILTEKLSLLFGNFEMVPVAPFDLKTSQAFISHNLSEIKINPSLKNFLIDFTGGHPFYLNILSQELVNLCAFHKQEEIFLPILSQAIEHTIFNKWGILCRHFEGMAQSLYGGKGNNVVLSILLSLANGRHKPKEILESIDTGKSLVSAKLKRLIEYSIVVKNGNFYYLHDKLFKYWIKYVLQKRLKSLSLNTDGQGAAFSEEIKNLVSHFQMVSDKDFSSRIIELLQCFDNETLSMNGRRYTLPIFEKITSLELSQAPEKKFEAIKASSKDGVWHIALKDGEFCEGDVNAFVSESKKFTDKPQKRLVISLDELDANTKLKALQEKVWIWNEGELNTLLNLYDKPYIVK